MEEGLEVGPHIETEVVPRKVRQLADQQGIQHAARGGPRSPPPHRVVDIDAGFERPVEVLDGAGAHLVRDAAHPGPIVGMGKGPPFGVTSTCSAAVVAAAQRAVIVGAIG